MSVDGILGVDAEEVITRFLRAISDPTRLRIVRALIERGPLTATECVAVGGVSQGRTSVHLTCLVDCGVVRAVREGRNRRYWVEDPRVAQIVILTSSVAQAHYLSIARCLEVGEAVAPVGS
ncbi:MAG: ArsR/SmtB family transcription factor [Ferrimicrobium sp.]